MKDAYLDSNSYISCKIHSQVEQTFFHKLITNFKAEIEKAFCIKLQIDKKQEHFLYEKANFGEDIQKEFHKP